VTLEHALTLQIVLSACLQRDVLKFREVFKM